VLVTACNLEGFDVLACGPEPMLHAIAERCPGAQLAWEAPMACGYGACYGCLDALAAPQVARQLDAFVTKTITPLPREGNAPPRIAETAHGMLNAIGLANPGRDRFLTDTLPRLRALDVPLWVSVGGFCAADY